MQTDHQMARMSPPVLSSADLIDAHSKALIASINALRQEADDHRAEANDADTKATALRAQLGDWNRVRDELKVGQQVATAADRVLGGEVAL